MNKALLDKLGIDADQEAEKILDELVQKQVDYCRRAEQTGDFGKKEEYQAIVREIEEEAEALTEKLEAGVEDKAQEKAGTGEAPNAVGQEEAAHFSEEQAQELKQRADQGDVNAQYDYARYLITKPVAAYTNAGAEIARKNRETAREYLTRAADQGDERSMDLFIEMHQDPCERKVMKQALCYCRKRISAITDSFVCEEYKEKEKNLKGNLKALRQRRTEFASRTLFLFLGGFLSLFSLLMILVDAHPSVSDTYEFLKWIPQPENVPLLPIPWFYEWLTGCVETAGVFGTYLLLIAWVMIGMEDHKRVPFRICSVLFFFGRVSIYAWHFVLLTNASHAWHEKLLQYFVVVLAPTLIGAFVGRCFRKVLYKK